MLASWRRAIGLAEPYGDRAPTTSTQARRYAHPPIDRGEASGWWLWMIQLSRWQGHINLSWSRSERRMPGWRLLINNKLQRQERWGLNAGRFSNFRWKLDENLSEEESIIICPEPLENSLLICRRGLHSHIHIQWCQANWGVSEPLDYHQEMYVSDPWITQEMWGLGGLVDQDRCTYACRCNAIIQEGEH
jgi:hypothetical protein